MLIRLLIRSLVHGPNMFGQVFRTGKSFRASGTQVGPVVFVMHLDVCCQFVELAKCLRASGTSEGLFVSV